MKNRFINISLLITALLYRFVRGTALTKAMKPATIIVFHEGKLGDMVCATPLFRAIKKVYPRARLIVCGNAINKQVVEFNPDIDVYEIIGKADIFDRIKIVRKYRPDFGVSVTPSFASAVAMFLGGVPVIAVPEVVNGWSPYETRPYKIIRKYMIAVPHRMGSYAPAEYLKLLEPIHIHETSTKKHVFFEMPSQSEIASQGMVPPSGSIPICISPCAGNQIKEWGAEKFTALIKKILKEHENAHIYLIGSKQEAKKVSEIASHFEMPSQGRISDLSGKLDLNQLKYLLSKMELFISVDTGPIYIAEALGIKTIDIVGPMDENEQPPRGEKNLVVVAPRKKPELHIMNARVYDKVEARRQVDDISVDMVMKALREII